ncbi:MAG: PKD domain-containing protein, partial [Actinomycetota bacterium]
MGGTVTFAGTGSDPDGDLPLSYRWDFDSPGGAAQPVEAVRTAEVGERAQPVGAAIESQRHIGLGTVHAVLIESTLEDPGPLIFTELGSHRVTFTVTDSRGLADPTPATRTVTVTDNLPPTAELVMSPVAGMAPLATTASAAGSVDPDGSIVSYRFDFGDGVTAGPQASPGAGHTYAAGTWTASVQVTDDEGGVGTASASVTVSSLMPNLVGNPSFETNTSGWAAYSSSTIARVAGGYQGSWALEVRGPSSTALFGVNDSPNWVASAPAVGTRYRISAWVRSAAGRGQVQLRIREYKGSSQVGPTTLSAPVTLSASWQEVAMDYVTAGSASTLDLQVLDTPAASSERFLLDNVWISIVPPPNQAPNGVIDQPTGPVTVTAGGSVTFAASGTDPDGNLPLSYQW